LLAQPQGDFALYTAAMPGLSRVQSDSAGVRQKPDSGGTVQQKPETSRVMRAA
jgi:hypothetical protein